MGFLVDDWDAILATSDEYDAGDTIERARGLTVPWNAPAP